MKWDDIPEDIQESLEEREISPERAESMSPSEIFAEHCNWNGLINWGPDLYRLAIEVHHLSGEADDYEVGDL